MVTNTKIWVTPSEIAANHRALLRGAPAPQNEVTETLFRVGVPLAISVMALGGFLVACSYIQHRGASDAQAKPAQAQVQRVGAQQ
jgi:hypothetical protein